MVDRQDIDALLIGSLYGELSSAEEARLTAHLESHPADRTALANLTHAREVVRESRILQVSYEPPQSISALLMQEAARRAPKPREEASWFQRFMRSFMTHPAMAAAAMLVLIVGVAGTVYMRQGDHFAKPTAENAPASPSAFTPSTEQPSAEQPSAAPSTGDTIATGSAAANGTARDDYRVGLDDETVRDQGVDKVVAADPPARPADVAQTQKNNKQSGGERAFGANERGGLAKEDAYLEGNVDRGDASGAKLADKPTVNAPVAKTAPKAAKPPRLEVSTPGQAPKDFDSVATKRGLEEAKPAEPKKPAETSVAGGAGGAPSTTATRTPGEARPGNASPAPAPPPPPPASVAVSEKEKQEKPDPILAWAKEQHGKVVAAVRAGKCQTAASLAVDISNRAPAYYAANVETDRTVKPCMQYITAQREKDAERVQRAKATQRRAADEAPAPSKPTSK